MSFSLKYIQCDKIEFSLSNPCSSNLSIGVLLYFSRLSILSSSLSPYMNVYWHFFAFYWLFSLKNHHLKSNKHAFQTILLTYLNFFTKLIYFLQYIYLLEIFHCSQNKKLLLFLHSSHKACFNKSKLPLIFSTCMMVNYSSYSIFYKFNSTYKTTIINVFFTKTLSNFHHICSNKSTKFSGLNSVIHPLAKVEYM